MLLYLVYCITVFRDLKWWISWGPYQIKAYQICEWRRFVVPSQEGVKEHAHQINFPAKPQKTQRCVIQGNGADSPPPPATQLRGTEAVAFAGDCDKTLSASTQNYCNRFRRKREMPGGLLRKFVQSTSTIFRDEGSSPAYWTRYGNPPAGGGRGIQEKSWAEIEIEGFQDTLKVERKAAAGNRTRGNSNGRCGPDEVLELMIYQDNQKSRTGEWRALNSCLASFAD